MSELLKSALVIDCIETFGHLFEAYRDQHLGGERAVEKCPGACIEAFGHLFEAYSNKHSGHTWWDKTWLGGISAAPI